MLRTSFRFLHQKFSLGKGKRAFFQSLANNNFSDEGGYSAATKTHPSQMKNGRREELDLNFVIDLFKPTQGLLHPESQRDRPKREEKEKQESDEEFIEKEKEDEPIRAFANAVRRKKWDNMNYVELGYLFRNGNLNKEEEAREGGLLEEAIRESGSTRSMFHRVDRYVSRDRQDQEDFKVDQNSTLMDLLQRYVCIDYLTAPIEDAPRKESQIEAQVEVEPHLVQSVPEDFPADYLTFVRTEVLLNTTGKKGRASALAVLLKDKLLKSAIIFDSNLSADEQFLKIAEACATEYKDASMLIDERCLSEEQMWRRIAVLYKESQGMEKAMTPSMCKRKWQSLVQQ